MNDDVVDDIPTEDSNPEPEYEHAGHDHINKGDSPWTKLAFTGHQWSQDNVVKLGAVIYAGNEHGPETATEKMRELTDDVANVIHFTFELGIGAHEASTTNCCAMHDVQKDEHIIAGANYLFDVGAKQDERPMHIQVFEEVVKATRFALQCAEGVPEQLVSLFAPNPIDLVWERYGEKVDDDIWWDVLGVMACYNGGFFKHTGSLTPDGAIMESKAEFEARNPCDDAAEWKIKSMEQRLAFTKEYFARSGEVPGGLRF